MITTNPAIYRALLEEKLETVKALFQDFALPEVSVYSSEPEYYRMRCEFRFWHEQEDGYYVMFDPMNPKNRIRVDEFKVASRLINEKMVAIRQRILDNQILRRKMFQVEFLTSTKDQCLVSLIYHRKLDDDWLSEAKKLAKELNIKLIGRSRKQKIIVSEDWIEEEFTVSGQLFTFKQYENSFTQPNAGLCQKMLQWAVDQSKQFSGDLLELYCGNGNFTLPLSKNFKQVFATEISRIGVSCARENIILNKINNTEVARISSEEFSPLLLENKLGELTEKQYNFSSLFVDPPRCGLDKHTLLMAKNFENIIYISCNPVTMNENIAELMDTHTISAFAVFDQFPYTHHIECGAILIKNQ